MNKDLILTIDQGTTSTRALVFSFIQNKILGIAQKEFTQYFPSSGWVEHDLEEIWETVLNVCNEAVSKAKVQFYDIGAIGITNQRETVCAWEKNSGKPFHRAIVWQDRRTSAFCSALKEKGLEKFVIQKTGLPIDPYFSASKIAWLIENNSSIKNILHKNNQVQQDNLAIGTIDSYLISRLTYGKSYVTDITNACRTNLFNIHNLIWDDELLEIYQIPKQILAEIKPSNAFFGETNKKIFGASIPITGVAGDQHASLFGHLGFESGMLKSTYGTGAFLLVNTGEKSIQSKSGLLSTIAYQLQDQKVHYALEGSIFVAGSALKWAKEKVNLFDSYKDIASIVTSEENKNDNQGVYLVPSFSGLGTPYWNPQARGAILGMSLKTNKTDLIRATLESLAYQTYDLVTALKTDGIVPTILKVDGGVVTSDWLLQFMAGVLDINIERAVNLEVTAMGATFLAALGIGKLKSTDELKSYCANGIIFEPKNPVAKNINFIPAIEKWRKAIQAVELFAR